MNFLKIGMIGLIVLSMGPYAQAKRVKGKPSHDECAEAAHAIIRTVIDGDRRVRWYAWQIQKAIDQLSRNLAPHSKEYEIKIGSNYLDGLTRTFDNIGGLETLRKCFPEEESE